MNCDTPINHKDGIATIRTMSWWPMRPAFHPHPAKVPSATCRMGLWRGRWARPRGTASVRTLPRVTVGAVGQAGLSPDSPSVRVSVFPPVIVRRLRRLRAALVRTVHCSSHAHRPVSLVPPTISGRIPVFLRYINIYISIIAGSRDAYFAGTRHCARVTSRCATPHQVTL